MGEKKKRRKDIGKSVLYILFAVIWVCQDKRYCELEGNLKQKILLVEMVLVTISLHQQVLSRANNKKEISSTMPLIQHLEGICRLSHGKLHDIVSRFHHKVKFHRLFTLSSFSSYNSPWLFRQSTETERGCTGGVAINVNMYA